ncbi:MAG: haloacid dehalogenase-like hydrolase [Oscillospiraceae bacterium]|nr:haloacid dehalogenase-like hydrolase [Oscillospiraceae bacterium]
MPNVYDMDKTIINTDSGIKFYFFCLRRHPSLLRFLPAQARAVLRFWLWEKNSPGYKGEYFSFLRGLKNLPDEVRLFWRLKGEDIVQPWYLARKRPDDIIISATPRCLLEPLLEQLGARFIGTRVNLKTGRVEGLGCRGAEKVRRLREEYGDIEIDNFYSDSLSDTPLAELAKRAWLVKGEKIMPWPEH